MRNGLVKFGGYLISGGAAAIVDAGGFALLIAYGVPLLPAAALSFIVAAVVNFYISSRWVFTQKPTAPLFTKFLLAALVGLTINVLVTVVLARAFAMSPALAKIGGIAVALIFNFTINLLLVFRARQTG